MNAQAYSDSEKLVSVLRTDIGLVREENQDCVTEAWIPLGYCCVVADGMGGHKGGRVAAELVVEGLERCMREAPASSSATDVMLTAFSKVNEIVHQKAYSGDPAVEKMGSTAVMLLISGVVAKVAHVGDSRAYLYRNGKLSRLTKDHTIVQNWIDDGTLTPEEAVDHPYASVLERAVGNRPDIKVDISNDIRILEGDAFLLCSDGLSGYVADGEIEAVLQSQAGVDEIPDQLTQLALHKGGEDNITVAFVQCGTRKPVQSVAVDDTRKMKAPKVADGLFRVRKQTMLLFVLLCLVVLAAIYYNRSGTKEGQTSGTKEGQPKNSAQPENAATPKTEENKPQ